MLILIVLFAIGLIGAGTMMFLQMNDLRSGKINPSHSYIVEPKININVGHMRRTLWQVLRAVVHIIIMKMIRLWAFISHLVAKKWNERFAKKDTSLTPTGEPIVKRESFFLHSISDYKLKLKKIKQKLKEKDISQLES